MIKESLFTAEERKAKLEKLGDMLQLMENHANFKGLAAHIDQAVPRLSQKKGGRPPFPTELMVRVLVPRQLHGFCDKRIEHQLMDRLSFQRFVGLRHSSQIPAPPLCVIGAGFCPFSPFSDRCFGFSLGSCHPLREGIGGNAFDPPPKR